jgi:hypothetical protein
LRLLAEVTAWTPSRTKVINPVVWNG